MRYKNHSKCGRLVYVSVNSKPDHPPGDSHILVAPGVGFSLLCLARGVLNQSKSSIILKKSAIFALSLKQLSSSSFHMFIYARSEQRDSYCIHTKNLSCLKSGVEFDMNDILYEFKNLHQFLRQLNFWCECGISPHLHYNKYSVSEFIQVN